MHTQQETAARSGFGPWGHKHCGGRGRHGGNRPEGRRGIPPWARFFDGSWAQAPVNIEETATSFVLTLYAAGLVKDNIKLSVQGDVLTIAYQGTDAAATDARYTRREFVNPSFERTFQLNGKVQTDAISAGYAEGILTVTLPKTPEASQPAQPIAVQ